MVNPDDFGRDESARGARTPARRRRRAAGLVSLALLAALAGCGSTDKSPKSQASSAPTSTQTPSTPASQKTAIALSTPIATSGTIPAQYQCVLTKVWVPLQWGKLPAGTRELGLYVASFMPHGSNIANSRIVSGSIMLGLTPDRHSLAVGKLPKGAVVGVDGAVPGCPAHSSGEKFLFRLYALPGAQGTSRGSPNGALLAKLRNEALAIGEFTVGHA
jgi:phosphatidylethanolamine-binding protein (PEBP) family uncharacterized protein